MYLLKKPNEPLPMNIIQMILKEFWRHVNGMKNSKSNILFIANNRKTVTLLFYGDDIYIPVLRLNIWINCRVYFRQQVAAKSTKIRPWMPSSSFSFSGLMSVAVTWAPSFANACRWKWQNYLFHAAENLVLWVYFIKPHSDDENIMENRIFTLTVCHFLSIMPQTVSIKSLLWLMKWLHH